jgi:hypothetical protein
MKYLNVFLFCTISVVATIGIAYGLYPHARLPQDVLMKNANPQPMESFDQLINLGDDYGEMSVIDLMGNYLDNPPQKTSTQQQNKPKRQFGGC